MIRYVALGRKIYLYKDDLEKRVRQVLWGDFLEIDGTHEQDAAWYRVLWAKNTGKAPLYIKKTDTVEQRPLEIVFVDVGQGDGAVLVTPERGKDEKVLVIDAGKKHHMHQFLNERFKNYRSFNFDGAIITHPDNDHYLGFQSIFKDKRFGFDNIFHNGLVERPIKGEFEKVGGKHDDPDSDTTYIHDLAIDRADIERLFGEGIDIGRFQFPNVMRAALDNESIKDFAMLSTAHGIKQDDKTFVPGFEPSSKRDYTLRVLGPIPEPDRDGKPRLRKIGGYGETKNGHSVLLRLDYGDFRILFGGDLNYKAEKFLLRYYTGLTRFPGTDSPTYDQMIENSRDTFGADVMKVCHHGSEKVTDAFLQAVNPACFVISSGDEEGHVHPRPDLLGRLGRFGRGKSPVLLSTELQRSTREVEDQDVVDRMKKDVEKLAKEANADKKLKQVESLQQRIDKLARTNVDVYGAIYVKTDGERLIAAFKKEEDSPTDRWFYFEYQLNEDGVLEMLG